MSEPLLEVTKVGFVDARGFKLHGISFNQLAGKRIAISGETGSGKSTLLKIIAGLEQPTAGTVLFEGVPVKGPKDRLVPGHPGIAYLPQYFELPKSLRVEQVLDYANKLSPNQASRLFRLCRISHLLKRKTNELSGGERQRVALCRLLIGNPKLLLLDEPYSNLDLIVKTTLKQVIRDVSEQLDITCILVSHDPDDTLPWAEHILILRNGRVVQTGNAETIYRLPKTEYVAGLFGEYNLISVKQAKQLGLQEKPPIVLRPDRLRVKKSRGGDGIVTQCDFMGSYFLVRVSWAKTSVCVAMSKIALKLGDRVEVMLG